MPFLITDTTIAFLGNGMCSVIQKMQQEAFSRAYRDEFMIMALFIVCMVTGLLSVIKERGAIKSCVKSGLHWGILCGIMNGMVNLFVMILSNRKR